MSKLEQLRIQAHEAWEADDLELWVKLSAEVDNLALQIIKETGYVFN